MISRLVAPLKNTSLHWMNDNSEHGLHEKGLNSPFFLLIADELAITGFPYYARPVNDLANCNKKGHI